MVELREHRGAKRGGWEGGTTRMGGGVWGWGRAGDGEGVCGGWGSAGDAGGGGGRGTGAAEVG